MWDQHVTGDVRVSSQVGAQRSEHPAEERTPGGVTTNPTGDVRVSSQVGAQRSDERGFTLWLTGLSGAGKSTVGTAVAEVLRAEGRPVEVLDGDEVRETLSPGLGFSREDRDAHVRRVGFLARMLARHGVAVVVPVIAPYADVREEIARAHEHQGVPHVLVYVSTDVAECARRDVKGLYAAQAEGRISHLTGVDDPYEPPTDPDLLLDTTGVPLETSRDVVLDLLTTKGLR